MMDRPKLRKLRKKIAKGLYVSVLANMEAFAVIVPMPWEKLTPEAREKWCKEADQILALLIPDIEEALKQRDKQWGEEVKRLFDKGYQKCLDDNIGFAEEAKREERERIKEHIVTLSKTNWTDEAQREEILKELGEP